MSLVNCIECKQEISEHAVFCPKCGHPLRYWRGVEWRSKAEYRGWPLVHIAFGRNKKTGKLLVAKGIIAIGQFAVGLVTFAQFGIGFLFGFGQFIGSFVAVAQFAAGVYFGLGQFASGMTAIGQLAVGKYCLAQYAFGLHVWSMQVHDALAGEYFRPLISMWVK